MLTISGNVVDVDTVIHDIGNDEIKLKIINIMNKSSYNYRFSSAQELYFILDMRKNIINASKKLFEVDYVSKPLKTRNAMSIIGGEPQKAVFY